jgi:hypothetical protein
MRIVSGGQTGVDRAALDLALAYGLAYDGWCPKGGWAEDLSVPPGLLAQYPELKETPLADPTQRTEWNVRDADVCVIVVNTGGVGISRGTALAQDLAGRYRKPLMVAELGAGDTVTRAARWLRAQREALGPGLAIAIGGPRESEAPGIYAATRDFLRAVLDEIAS